MNKMMKICGKSIDGRALPFAVDEKGETLVKRVWETKYEVLLTQNGIDTSVKTIKGIDVSDAGLVSLRVENATDSDIDFHLFGDIPDSAGNMTAGWMIDINGNYITFTVPAKSFAIITPEDVPALNYQYYMGLRMQAKTASDGYLRVILVTKG